MFRVRGAILLTSNSTGAILIKTHYQATKKRREEPSMSKIKIGVLGGTRGLDFLTRVLVNHPCAEVTAICEAHAGLREKIRSAAQALPGRLEVFSDYDEFLSSGVDAVIIANFANEHAPYAIRALKRGIHVLSENLPTQTMARPSSRAEKSTLTAKITAICRTFWKCAGFSSAAKWARSCMPKETSSTTAPSNGICSPGETKITGAISFPPPSTAPIRSAR